MEMQAAGDATTPNARLSVAPSTSPDSTASNASNAVSSAGNGPAQIAIPSGKSGDAVAETTRSRGIGSDANVASPSAREANEADDETESEAEMDFEASLASQDTREVPESRVGPTPDDSEEEEEEDEEFPPAPPLPSPSSSTTSVASVAAAPEPLERGPASHASATVRTSQQPRQAAIVHLEEAVDAQADEKLLRVLLSHKSRLTDASRPQDAVWDAVAAELGSRQVATDAVKVRVRLRWLQQVSGNPAHAAHSRLTGPMRAMLAEVTAVMSPAPRATPVVEKQSQASAPNKRRKVALDEETYLRIEREKLLSKQQQQHQQQSVPVPVIQSASVAGVATDGTGQPTQAVETETAPLPTLPKQHVKSVLNVALEEKIMAIVLKHAPKFLTAKHRNDVWEAIARDSRGRYESSSSAKSHYVWLTQIVLNDPTHREYAKVTPKLRSMCAQVQSYASRRTKTSPANKLKPPTHANAASVVAPVATQPSVAAQPSIAAQHSGAAQPFVVGAVPPDNLVSAANPAKPVVVKKNPAKIVAAKPPKYESTLTVAADYDEVLMEQYLLKRPFDYDRYTKPAVWKEIASIVPDPRVISGVYGQKRVTWLAEVYRNPADIEHAKLTPKLRKLLQEYTELLASGEASSKRLGRPQKREFAALVSSAVPGVAAGVAAATAAPIVVPVAGATGAVQPLLSPETIATQRPRRQNTKRVFDEYVTMEESSDDEKGGSRRTLDAENDEDMAMVDGEASEASPYADEVLIREILRVRPFHKKRGEGMQLWGVVQAAVARQVGSANVFPTAERCWMRMRKLMSVVRNPKGAGRVSVSSRLLDMLYLLDTVIKTKWPLTAHRLKNEHHVILGKIEDILQRPVSSDPHDEAPRSAIPVDSREDGEAEDDFTQELWRNEQQAGEQDEEEGDQEEEEYVEPPVELTADQINSMGALGPALLEALRPGLGVHASGAIPAQAEAPHTADQLSTPVKSLEECVRQLDAQTKNITQEREQHRRELRTLVEMLKEEREQHRRDTEAMVAVIKQEREDRKSEFVAMMNLITRSVLPAEPPSQ